MVVVVGGSEEMCVLKAFSDVMSWTVDILASELIDLRTWATFFEAIQIMVVII